MEERVDIYKQLYTKYPDFVGAGPKFGGFSVGDGWFNLIDTLCGQIEWYVKQHNEYVAERLAKIENKADKISDYAPELLEPIKMPRIEQVKEKFGSLRFYMSGGDRRIHAWVEFAEALSATICEECGAPGTMRDSTGWVHCLCDRHEEEYLAQRKKQREQYA